MTQVTAPAGDARFQRSGTAALARVFVRSDFTGNRALLQGTSMASSHVPGVAALASSARGRTPHRQAFASGRHADASLLSTNSAPYARDGA